MFCKHVFVLEPLCLLVRCTVAGVPHLLLVLSVFGHGRNHAELLRFLISFVLIWICRWGVSIRGSVAREAGGVVLDAIIGHSRGGGISMRVSVARGVGTSGAELKTIPNTDGIKQYPLTLTLVLMHGVGDGGA